MNTDTLHIIQRILTVLVAIPYALQLWGFFVGNRYKNAARDIHTTNREIFRSIKLRYTNSARLNIPLSDTDSFISKYFYGKGGPFRHIANLERISAILCCLALLGTTALYVRGYAGITRMVAMIAATLCYYIFRCALSTEKSMELTLSFTKDYLNNTLKHRISPEPMRHVKGDAPATTADVENVAPVKPDIAAEKAESLKAATDDKVIDITRTLNNENSDIIEAVLQEFLA